MARHNDIGKLGESIAAEWCARQGYVMLGLNYRRKYGEIDVIAKYKGTVHFVEVKTVSYETVGMLKRSLPGNHRGGQDVYQPEEKVHAYKLKRLVRVIETWIAEKGFDGEWQIDVAAVRVVPKQKYAHVTLLEQVNID